MTIRSFELSKRSKLLDIRIGKSTTELRSRLFSIVKPGESHTVKVEEQEVALTFSRRGEFLLVESGSVQITFLRGGELSPSRASTESTQVIAAIDALAKKLASASR